LSFAPTNRLILLVAAFGIPVFTMLGLEEAPGAVMVALGLLSLVLLGIDAPSAFRSISRLQVQFPPLTRTTNGRAFELKVTLTQPQRASRRKVQVGLFFPEVLRCAKPILSVALRQDTPRYTLTWDLQALERGIYRLEACYVGGVSRLGLWSARRTFKINAEIRVYPDLSRERSVLAPLFFRRGAVGMHQIRQIGKGREFEQLRAYAPGDSYEDIYWKGTAKRRAPVTRMYQLERTQELYVVLDASRRSARRLESLSAADGATPAPEALDFDPKTQLDRFIQAALVLALAAEQQQDKCGLLIFSDQVHRIIPAGGGRGHYDIIRDVLYALQPRPVSPDFQEAFVHIGNHLRHRSRFIFLTDLGEPWLAESFIENVNLNARRHVVLAHMRGPRDVQPLFTKNDTAEDADALYQKLAGQLLWHDLQETTRLLKQRGVHLTASLQENLVADVISEYLRVKKRQLI